MMGNDGSWRAFTHTDEEMASPLDGDDSFAGADGVRFAVVRLGVPHERAYRKRRDGLQGHDARERRTQRRDFAAMRSHEWPLLQAGFFAAAVKPIVGR